MEIKHERTFHTEGRPEVHACENEQHLAEDVSTLAVRTQEFRGCREMGSSILTAVHKACSSACSGSLWNVLLIHKKRWMGLTLPHPVAVFDRQIQPIPSTADGVTPLCRSLSALQEVAWPKQTAHIPKVNTQVQAVTQNSQRSSHQIAHSAQFPSTSLQQPAQHPSNNK